MTKEQIARHSKKKRIEALEKIKDKYPTLYWAKRFHRNTRDEEMEFTDVHYLLDLYKNIHNYPLMVVKKSVQCCLSELFIANAHKEANDGLTVFYVLPKYEIRNRFVNNRIHRLHRRSGYYANKIREAKHLGGYYRTALMHFGKGTMAFVGSNVEDEFIEIPVDSSYVDEKDRCNMQNLALLPDRLTASPHKFQREISNPTIEEFGIDERYLSSTQGAWVIKCESCNTYFEPNFFDHVVREIGTEQYEARDPAYYERGEASLICHKCGAKVDRLKKGEWIHAYPDRDWVGFHISKLFNKYSGEPGEPLFSVANLIEKWIKIQGHQLQIQIFYNSELGLAFSSAGAKIHQWQLDACKRNYEWPVVPVTVGGLIEMGVDVGAVLNVVIRERVKYEGRTVRRLLYAAEVPTFPALSKLIDMWQPRVVVIDADPEIHEVSTLKSKHKNVWASRFKERLLEMGKDRRKKTVSMDRTALLDVVKKSIDEEEAILPMQADRISNGLYYSQMVASTRVLEVDETNPERNRFVWKHTKPDHYFLAEAYCVQADFLLPDSLLFEFYKSEANRMGQGEKDLVPETIIEKLGQPKTEEEIRQLQTVSQGQFLAQKDRSYTAKAQGKIAPEEKMNRDILLATEQSLGDAFTLREFERISGLRKERAVQFLQKYGYVSNGSQWKKKSL